MWKTLLNAQCIMFSYWLKFENLQWDCYVVVWYNQNALSCGQIRILCRVVQSECSLVWSNQNAWFMFHPIENSYSGPGLDGQWETVLTRRSLPKPNLGLHTPRWFPCSPFTLLVLIWSYFCCQFITIIFINVIGHRQSTFLFEL